MRLHCTCMHSDHFSWKSKQLLPPCTYHTCEIATCRLKLWAPLVASNTNDDDNDDDNNNNNNNNNIIILIIMLIVYQEY